MGSMPCFIEINCNKALTGFIRSIISQIYKLKIASVALAELLPTLTPHEALAFTGGTLSIVIVERGFGVGDRPGVYPFDEIESETQIHNPSNPDNDCVVYPQHQHQKQHHATSSKNPPLISLVKVGDDAIGMS